MTGEIDLEGKARQIGGLYSKLQGALNAGAKEVLIPRSNEKDLDTIFSKEFEEIDSLKNSTTIKDVSSYSMINNESTIIDKNTRLFRNQVTVRLVDNIYEILKYSLVENDMIFNSVI